MTNFLKRRKLINNTTAFEIIKFQNIQLLNGIYDLQCCHADAYCYSYTTEHQQLMYNLKNSQTIHFKHKKSLLGILVYLF